MSSERRLIQDATPGGMSHRLLRAGREASPSADSKQHLIAALLPSIEAPGAGAGAAKTGAVKAAASSLKASVLSKLAVLSVIGAAATGAWYAARPMETEREDQDKARIPADPSGSIAAVTPSATKPDSALPSVKAREVREGLPPGARTGPPPALKAARPLPLRRGRTPASTVSTGALAPVRALSSQTQDPVAGADSELSLPARREVPSVTRAEDGMLPTSASLTPKSASVLSDTQLSEELRELDAVRDAVRSGNRSAARELLAEYFRRFPNGFLAPEAGRLTRHAGDTAPR